MIFSVGLLKFLVLGGIGLCSLGALSLLACLFIDIKRQRTW